MNPVSSANSLNSALGIQRSKQVSQIQLAIVKKIQNNTKAQGEAVMKLLESAAKINQASGSLLDVKG